MQTLTKVLLMSVMFMFTFGVVSYFAGSDMGFGTAVAATTCGDCEPDPEPPTGGGGGSTSNPPSCNITANVTSVKAGDQFTISWNGTPTSAKFKVNGAVVNAKDSATYTFDGQYDYARFVFYGENSDGKCDDEVVVNKKVETVAPVCTISANVSSVAVGGTYTITWNGTPSEASFKINGSSVADSGSATFTFVGPNKESFTFTGENGGKTCTKTVEVLVKTTPAPTCDSFTAAPTSLPAGGGNTVLKWSTTNADSVSISGIGSVAVDNTTGLTKAITQTTTYTLTASKAGQTSDTCTVKITVATTTPAPTCTFSVSPTTIEKGHTATLSWSTTNATVRFIDRIDGVIVLKPVAVSGTYTVSPDVTTTYVLHVSNADGASDTCRVTVTVTDIPPTLPSCDYLTASPMSLPNGGGTTVLKWETTNADSVSISGIGSVSADNTTGLSKTITQTTTYTLTASKAGQPNDTCAVTITVDEDHGGSLSCSDNVDFTATDYGINEGDGTTLIWNTTGVDSVSISEIGATSLDGSQTVSPNSDTTYVLTATADGDSVDCPLTISVDEDDGGGGGSSGPRCDLDISDEDITAGEEVTLEWNTSYSDEITLEDNHGNTIIESDDNDDLDGEIKIRPTEDTTFTLTAAKGSKDDECKVEVDVEGGVTVTETRTQLPTVAGISLTQVPYTGFEAGPMLTTIFYALLTIWGLFVAYVVAVRRNMIGGVSLAGAHDHVAFTDVSTEAAPASTYVASVTESAIPANLPTGIAPVVGYAAAAVAAEVVATPDAVDASIEMTELENRAHMQKALFSSDAMRHFMSVTPIAERANALDAIIAKAKAAFPSEDGWLVVNLTRLESLMVAAPVATAAVVEVTGTNGGSLAEAIVTSNIVAAYQLIAHRPMIALADAAAELDAVVRARRGEVVSLSNMLASATASLSDAQVTAAIAALTSAIDGTYASEEEAVKMAIMKAVKAVA